LSKILSFFLSFFENKKENDIQYNLESLEKILKITINDKHLFNTALTHSSDLSVTRDGKSSNERLEFLGDSILGMVVAEYLFNLYTDEEEGFLTKIRSQLVNRDTLAEAAKRIGLQQFLHFNDTFLKNSSNKGLITIISDAVEALVAAIYIDQGFNKAKVFIYEFIIEPNIKERKFLQDKNYKGILLEYTHTNHISPPVYQLIEEAGPEHNKTFTINVLIQEQVYGTGIGPNKKSAEKNAAHQALKRLNL